MTALPPDAAEARDEAVDALQTRTDGGTPDATGDVGGSDGVDEPPASTGVAAADEAAERLRDLDDAPIDRHVEIYEDAHRRLEEGLSDLDER
jgi:hypothetical protein